METNTNDANTEQVVTAQDANNEQVVAAQGDNTDLTNQNQNDPVPYDRFKEVNDAKKVAEENAAFAQRELDVLKQAQQLASQQTQQTTQQAGSTFEQAMINLGVSADELYGDAIVKVNNEKARLDGIVNQQQSAFTANQQFIASHSDFTQVVGSVNPSTGQIMTLTQEAMSLLQRKQYLANAPVQAIYDEVLQERKLAELEKTSTVNQEHLNRQTTDNQTAPLGGSAAGGAGGGSQNETVGLLTREQLNENLRKLAAGEFDQ